MKKSSTLWIIIAFLALSISLTSVFIAFSPQLVGDKLGADESDTSSDTSADTDDEWTKDYGDESDNIHFGPIHQIGGSGAFDGEIDTDLSEDSDTEAGDSTDTGSSSEPDDSIDTESGETDDPILKSFSISGLCDGTVYPYGNFNYVEGMTWREFIESEYNTGRKFSYHDDIVFYDGSFDISASSSLNSGYPTERLDVDLGDVISYTYYFFDE